MNGTGNNEDISANPVPHKGPAGEPECEMVNRVAQAIFDVAPFRDNYGPFSEQSELYQRLTKVYARAAIEAMLEPTDAMLARGSEAAEVCDDGWESNATWCAMIYAALEGAP